MIGLPLFVPNKSTRLSQACLDDNIFLLNSYFAIVNNY